MSHAIPFLMFQVLKSNPWNLNVFWMYLEWRRGGIACEIVGELCRVLPRCLFARVLVVLAVVGAGVMSVCLMVVPGACFSVVSRLFSRH